MTVQKRFARIQKNQLEFPVDFQISEFVQVPIAREFPMEIPRDKSGVPDQTPNLLSITRSGEKLVIPVD